MNWFISPKQPTAIVSDEPQPVDHGHYHGFDVREPYDGYLIAESVVHRPYAQIIAAAPVMLRFAEFMAEKHPEGTVEGDAARTVIRIARGEQ